MQKIIYIVLFLSFCFSIKAQDTTWIQTLTFDSITTRRGIWEFPDTNETYRKIMMYHTLKCDAATTQDQYPCGEWDYLTYTKVYNHTGEMIQDSLSHPFFKVADSVPVSFNYTNSKIYDTYLREQQIRIIDETINETVANIGEGASKLTLDNKVKSYQFIIKKNKLEASNLTSGEIHKLKVQVLNKNFNLRNFKIRLKNTNVETSDSLFNYNLSEVYNANTYFETPGIHEIVFTSPFTWDGNSNILVEFSYNLFPWQENKIDLSAISNEISLLQKRNFYLDFEGDYKAVNCGQMNILKETSEFTIEAWINLPEYVKSKNIFQIGDCLFLKQGGASKQLRFILKNGNALASAYANILQYNKWQHVAVVFNGNAPDNADKVKIYINGEAIPLTYVKAFPSTTITNDNPFLINTILPNNNNLQIYDLRIWKSALNEDLITQWKDSNQITQHPQFDNLGAYYPMNEGTGFIINDESGNGNTGNLIGVPVWKELETKLLISSQNQVPAISFIQGEYSSHIENIVINELIQKPPTTIVKYKIDDYIAVPDSFLQVYSQGSFHTYDTTGVIIESTDIETNQSIENYTLEYLSNFYEKIEPYELGRFITPYGIQLNLGPNGFTWVYDVTDYEPLLHGLVDLSSGNQQELIDLKFAFIKGTPGRKVNNIQKIWGGLNSYSYGRLHNNTALSETEITIANNTKNLKLVTRLTGHGHFSNDGSYPHCCEWKDNTHYLYMNGNLAEQWHIWKGHECATNPVYPQGGTWPGAREGWCPGDVVRDYAFDLSEYIDEDRKFTIDYDITDIPENNQGMSKGSYKMAFQLFEYENKTYQTDAEIYDVISPNNFEYYSRKNPLCEGPQIVIKNNGAEMINSISFDYWVSGGKIQNYQWSGELNSFENKLITLPISDESFWIGDEKSKFYVQIQQVNGSEDEDDANNLYQTNFELPDIYSEDIIIELKTRNYAEYLNYCISDETGNVIRQENELNSQVYYRDTLRINNLKGCITYNLIDSIDMGLSYWAVPSIGNGSLKIRALDGSILKNFISNFGYQERYSFILGGLVTYIKENNIRDKQVNVYPNPSNGDFSISFDGYNEPINLKVTDMSGKVVYQSCVDPQTINIYELSLPSSVPGIYILSINDGKSKINKRLIVSS